MLIYLIKGKLNNYTREWWQESMGTSKVPKLENMIFFLERRAQFEVSRPMHNPPQAIGETSTNPRQVIIQINLVHLSRLYHILKLNIIIQQKHRNLSTVVRYARENMVCLNSHNFYSCPQRSA